MFQFVDSQIDNFLKHWPKDIVSVINEFGDDALDVALQLEVEATREFTPQHYIDEIKGLAQGVGLTYVALLQSTPALMLHCF